MVKGSLRGLKLRILSSAAEEPLYLKAVPLYVMSCSKVDRVKSPFRMYVPSAALMARKLPVFLDPRWFRCFTSMFVAPAGMVMMS